MNSVKENTKSAGVKVSSKESTGCFGEYKELISRLEGSWIEQDTAILVVHGIGHQHPLETLDGFSRGLIDSLKEINPGFTLKHQLARKSKSGTDDVWFDNYLRISAKGKDGMEHHLDIYEYYWAPETEGQATINDLNRWLSGVTKGARRFYRNNIKLAKENNDDSILIRNGEFNPFMYWVCVNAIPFFMINANFFFGFLAKLIAMIPILGPIISKLILSKFSTPFERITNVLNDIAIYNTIDAKSRFFKIRNCILSGGVKALRYLLEEKIDPADENLNSFTYGKVLLCGHSLGSQIAFDTINELNHLVNQGEIKGYNRSGACSRTGKHAGNIAEKLCGIVTFGSPLDKIAFFFRQQVSDREWVRASMLRSFHGFRQKDWVTHNGLSIDPIGSRVFDKIPWKNYWDKRDYVSGPLDYYSNVDNIECKFESHLLSFTHGRYWECPDMYAEILMLLFKKDRDSQAGQGIPVIEKVPAE